MKKILFTALIALYGFTLFGQSSLQIEKISTDCNNDFWTITSDGYIQQWSLSNGTINGGDTILSGGGTSLSYCGIVNAPTFFTAGGSGFEVRYFDTNSGWISIPNFLGYDMMGGHLNHNYSTIIGGVIQWVTYWDGTNLLVIDSLAGEFFAGIFDIGVDTLGHAWIFTASSPGIAVDSLKVYDQSGQINAYSIQFNIEGYGSFFLNDTLYIGTLQDSIFPVIISGTTAQLGIGIPFPSNNFTDMASCQITGTTSLITNHPNRKIKIFPNPTNGYLLLPIDIERPNIWVYNSIGQLVEHKLDGNILDLAEQPPGMYYIKIYTEGWSTIYKVMKF